MGCEGFFFFKNDIERIDRLTVPVYTVHYVNRPPISNVYDGSQMT